MFGSITAAPALLSSADSPDVASMASPLAAGIAGLVLSAAPDLTPIELIDVLTKTSRKSTALEGKLKHAVVLDAEAAVLNVLSSDLH